LGHALASALAAKTAFAVAAKPACRVEHVGAVDPYHASLELRRDMKGEIDVLTPYRGGQTVARVVGQFDGFFRIAERHRGQHRAEHFLLSENVGRSYICRKNWQVIPAGGRDRSIGHPALGTLRRSL